MHRLFKIALCSCALLALGALLLLKGGVTKAASPQTCGSWNVVASPNKAKGDVLFDVAAISSSDVWTVGYYSPNSFSLRALTEHWNGSTWSLIPTPQSAVSLGAVAAVASNDVWAVGDSSTTINPLFLHWNGTRWSIVASPNIPNGIGNLTKLAAVTSNDVWAVGYIYMSNKVDQTLIEHWDGTQWSIVPGATLPPSSTNSLDDVKALSANNVWAMGGYFSTQDNLSHDILERWNGTQWSIVPGSDRVATNSFLESMTVLAANNIWVAGIGIAQGSPKQTLILHWNGTQWKIVPSPNVGSSDNELFGVAAISPKNIWVVGDYYANNNTVVQTLTEQWNGMQWSVISSPNPGSAGNFLIAVNRVPGTGQLWTVGFFANKSGADQTLTEFYC